MQFTVTITGSEGTSSTILTAQELERTETVGSLVARAQYGSMLIERV